MKKNESEVQNEKREILEEKKVEAGIVTRRRVRPGPRMAPYGDIKPVPRMFI